MGQHGKLVAYACKVHGHLMDALDCSVKRIYCERCGKWIDAKDARRYALETGKD